jgi:cell division protein FtsL
MNNLLPVGKETSKSKQTNKKSTGIRLGKTSDAKKERNRQAEVGLSKNQTVFLAIAVIGLSLAVIVLAFWIRTLTTQSEEKQLVINRLEREIEVLNNEHQDETVVASVTYNALPEDPSPDTSDEAQNPDVAQIQQFNYQEIFDQSQMIVTQNQRKSYYICNEKAALRLIEDSGLDYLISEHPNSKYNLLLLGDYEPEWISELQEWEERRNRLLTTVSQQATDSENAATTLETFNMPEELEGLEAQKQDYLIGIQILSSSSREEVNKKVWILRNENIPAYIYSYPKNYSTSYQYTLQVNMFPTREEAIEFQSVLNQEYRDIFLEMIGNDVTRSYPRNIMSND